MASLVPAHGGLTEPLDLHRSRRRSRRVHGRRREAAEGARLRRRPVDRLSLRRRRAQPADRADGRRHLQPRARRVGHRAQRQALRLDDSALAAGDRGARRRRSKAGQTVALVELAPATSSRTLEISDVFAWDKPRYLKSVYLTERTDHPGADMVLKGDADKTHLLGGTIRVLPQPKNPQVRQVRAHAARSPQAAGREGLEPRRRVPDPQPAAPRPRVRAGLRPRDAAPRKATTPARCSIR